MDETRNAADFPFIILWNGKEGRIVGIYVYELLNSGRRKCRPGLNIKELDEDVSVREHLSMRLRIMIYQHVSFSRLVKSTTKYFCL